MRVDDQQLPEYFEFASEALGEEFTYGRDCRCLANVHDDGRIAGVVIYTHMSDFNCVVHVASDGTRRWVTPEMLFWTFAIPFEQWGKLRVTGLVAESNKAALRFDLGLGFVIEGRIRRAFGDEDGILLGMLRDECRFLKLGAKNGREK